MPPEPDLPPPPEPHAIQRRALEALGATRQAGNQAGLVVLATGLGKTWLAAFDSLDAGAERVLFIAHREEILDQALHTFRRIRPQARLGRFVGGVHEGTVAVTVDGEDYEADFRKVPVNVMRRAGTSENVLPEVLRGWFGEEAGASGSTHRVVFVREQMGYTMERHSSDLHVDR